MLYNIQHISYIYENLECTDVYKIYDSDFICKKSVRGPCMPHAAITFNILVNEYQRRNACDKEIIKNLFILNSIIIKNEWYDTLGRILAIQEFHIKRNYPLLSNYYNDLVKYTKKMMVIS